MDNLLQKMMQSGTNGGNGNGRNRDVVVTVQGYTLDGDQPTMQVKEGDDAEARIFNVMIRKGHNKSYKPDADMEGNQIDQRMQSYIAPGQKVILERLTDFGQNGPDSRPMSCNWIHTAPGNEAKLVQGIMTLKGYRQDGKLKTSHIQQWSEKSLSMDLLDAYCERLDQGVAYACDRAQKIEASKGGDASVVIPAQKATVGFALRAISDDQILAYTPPFTYNPGTKLPMSGADLRGTIDAFKDALENTGGIDANTVTIEICPCRSFRASVKGNLIAPPRLLDSKGTFIPGMDKPAYGNEAMAVAHGVLKLSPGKYNSRTQQIEGADEEYVNVLLASAKAQPLQELIPDSQGRMLKLSDELPIETPNYGHQQEQTADNTPQQAESAPAQTAAAPAQPAQETAPQQGKPEPAPMDSDGLDDELDNALAAASAQMTAPSP